MKEINRVSNAIKIDLQNLYSIKHIALFNANYSSLKKFEIYLSNSTINPDFQHSYHNKLNKIFTSSKEIPKNRIFSEYFDCNLKPRKNHIGKYFIIQSSEMIQICQIRIDGEIHGFFIQIIKYFVILMKNILKYLWTDPCLNNICSSNEKCILNNTDGTPICKCKENCLDKSDWF